MATRNTNTADGSLTINAERIRVALESTWESAALLELLEAICGSAATIGDVDDIHERLSEFSHQARGLCRRMSQLTGVVMSVLDDDAETVDLQRKVFGFQRAASNRCLVSEQSSVVRLP